MKDQEKPDLLNWIHCWEKAGEAMEQSRRDNLKNVNVQEAIENLDDAFESALFTSSFKPASGLVEMQSWFARAPL